MLGAFPDYYGAALWITDRLRNFSRSQYDEQARIVETARIVYERPGNEDFVSRLAFSTLLDANTRLERMFASRFREATRLDERYEKLKLTVDNRKDGKSVERLQTFMREELEMRGLVEVKG